MKVKKIPLRKCTGCLIMKEKKELIRVAKSNTNEFYLDTTGKKPGRGAYICKNIQCFEKANKSRGLERSFKQGIPKDVYLNFKKEIEIINE
jgi:uncharacterized protein